MSQAEAFIQHEPVLVTKDSDACVLSPSSMNVHEITAPHGTTAFLDILAPPYNDDRVCGYYKVLPDGGAGAENQVVGPDGEKIPVKYLVRCPQPSEFHCEPLDYTGPELEGPDDSSDESDDS